MSFSFGSAAVCRASCCVGPRCSVGPRRCAVPAGATGLKLDPLTICVFCLVEQRFEWLLHARKLCLNLFVRASVLRRATNFKCAVHLNYMQDFGLYRSWTLAAALPSPLFLMEKERMIPQSVDDSERHAGSVCFPKQAHAPLKSCL